MDDLELRQQIAHYVAGKSEVDELEAWLSGEMADLDELPYLTRRLAAQVMRVSAERANGDWTDDQLRAYLGDLSRTYWFETAPKTVIADSVAGVIRRNQQSVAAGKRLAAEYA